MRPFAVQLWYPAVRGTGADAPYLDEPALLDSMMQRGYLDMDSAAMRGWGTVRLAARLNATPAPAQNAQGWPVLILSHGLGVARAHYSALSQELASHGYVVITVDHPIGGFTLDPAGRVLTPGVDTLDYDGPLLPSVVRDWAEDADFVLRRVANARDGNWPPVDTARVGMLGHSLGGAAALQACRDVAVFRACADMDGDPFGDIETMPVGKPFLVLLSAPDHRDEPPPRDSAEAAARARLRAMGLESDSMWAVIGARNGRMPWFVERLIGTGHFSFSDGPFQLPSQLEGVGATMPAEAMYRTVADLLLTFFDHFLRGQPLHGLRPGMHRTG